MTMPNSNPKPNRPMMAGGAPLALCTIAGPFVAGLSGYSPSIGFLAGLGVGIAVALLIWIAAPR